MHTSSQETRDYSGHIVHIIVAVVFVHTGSTWEVTSDSEFHLAADELFGNLCCKSF